MMTQPDPLDIEVKFLGGNMITETDLMGNIVYVNRLFEEMSGYSKKELIGVPHSIIRHPDMPKECFSQMWKTLETGDVWKGYVKNLRKDGAFYWVIVHVAPKFDSDGRQCGYIAVRKPPGELTLEEMKKLYKDMLKSEDSKLSHLKYN